MQLRACCWPRALCERKSNVSQKYVFCFIHISSFVCLPAFQLSLHTSLEMFTSWPPSSARILRWACPVLLGSRCLSNLASQCLLLPGVAHNRLIPSMVHRFKWFERDQRHKEHLLARAHKAFAHLDVQPDTLPATTCHAGTRRLCAASLSTTPAGGARRGRSKQVTPLATSAAAATAAGAP